MTRIDLHEHRIVIDGRPSLTLAGEVHYFRVPRAEWGDRLDRLVELGCGTVASYLPWLFHELPDGSIDVTGRTRPERDVGAFIDLCAERGLSFLARPGPFVMAELKNEGLPYRLYRQHPEIVPRGWDARPTPTATVDYLAPAFLGEIERWYAAVLPIVAARLAPNGGPVIGVQLDNEIGMLAWVANSPDLSDLALAELRAWCADRYGDSLRTRYPAEIDDPAAWASAVRSPDERWAAALRVDLGRFMRDRFARYVDALTALAARHGIDGVPLMINIHGTEGGDGIPFGIGVSQLLETYAGRPGVLAGSDHYLGEASAAVLADLHFINAAMAAVNGPDQPLTSLEFEAGTGDYSGGLDALADPSTVDLKTRICLAQGNRLINYYLLAGGINPPLDQPVGDGNDRLSFTGERHGTAAPIGPLGERGLAYAATGRAIRAAQLHARWLADMDEEHDDLGAGFWPDAFMTEYRHPDSAIMAELTEDLRNHRGPGARKAWWRALLWAGFRFSARNLQDPAVSLPTVVALSCGQVLGADVQRRLVDHVRGGGSLLLLGRLPRLDLDATPCTLLGDALGLRPGERIVGTDRRYPSLVGAGLAAGGPETRVGWLDELIGSAAEPLFRDLDGRLCGATVTAGAGRAVVITADIPAQPELFTALAGWLGAEPGLGLRTDVPGITATSTVTPAGERLLHLVNPTGYPATVQVTSGDPTGLLDQPLALPARTGVMLGVGLELPGIGTLLAANAELTLVEPDRIAFGPGLGDHTEIRLRTTRPVLGVPVDHEDGVLIIRRPRDDAVELRFG